MSAHPPAPPRRAPSTPAGPRAARAASATAIAGALASLTGAATACGADDAGLPAADAGEVQIDASAPVDAAPADDDVPLTWVDFAIAGCERIDDRGEARPACVGAAPLTLRFIPLAAAAIDVYRWSFGDDSADSTEPSPEHRFELPGTYDVSLTAAGPGGTARADGEDAVFVQPAATGARCELNAQCAGDICVCGEARACEDVSAGFCTSPCAEGAAECETGSCADLNAGGAGENEPWRAELCVAECEVEGECAAGQSCVSLPEGGDDEVDPETGGEAGAWVRGCAPTEALAPLGADCFDAAGAPDHAACASGFCADIGARGMCASPCDERGCPPGAACAEFEDDELGSLCLPRCESDEEAACEGDPWLACEDPEGDGFLAFSVTEDPADAGYCAPKSCDEAGDCGSEGACEQGYCGPR